MVSFFWHEVIVNLCVGFLISRAGGPVVLITGLDWPFSFCKKIEYNQSSPDFLHFFCRPLLLTNERPSRTVCQELLLPELNPKPLDCRFQERNQPRAGLRHGAEQRVVTNFGTRQRRWLSRWNEWVLLVCDMEKYKKPSKSPMCTLSQNGYGARNVAAGLNSLGLPMKN